jgi:hypothetical protein
MSNDFARLCSEFGVPVEMAQLIEQNFLLRREAKLLFDAFLRFSREVHAAQGHAGDVSVCPAPLCLKARADVLDAVNAP